MNTTYDKNELSEMLQSLNLPQLHAVCAVFRFFLALEWARKQARRFIAWVTCHA
jgi:hypothetical protein